ncbi:MAG: hypothetical protein QM621_01055, partial [Aeromicrobium sp.]|uniref:Ig-like domain-containing protein n=1 Tax=Aeromicrobium sp. TaxID=1871063 RepID=UPI0039E554B1
SEDGSETFTSTMVVDVIGEVADDTATMQPGETSVTVDVLANDSVDGVVLDPTSVRLVDPGTGALVDEVVVSGVGVWSVDTTTGAVTFTPVPNYVGEVPAVSYVVTGDDGATYTADVSVEALGAADDDVAYTAPGGPGTVDPLANDSVPGAVLNPASVRLVDPATGDETTTLTTAEGAWTVNPATGRVTFTPTAGYVGTPAPVAYLVDDGEGRTYTATITVTAVGEAADDQATASDSGPVVIDPLANDSVGTVLIPSSVRLIDPDTGLPVTELAADGVGTWTVDTTTGRIAFTPADGFTGAVPPVVYIVTGENGLTYGAMIELTIEPATDTDTDTTGTADDPDDGPPGLLPGTGTPVPPIVLLAALLAVVVGAALLRRSRRHNS